MRKIGDLRRKGLPLETKEGESSSISLIDKHYFSNPLLSGLTNEQIRQKSLTDLSGFFGGVEDRSIHDHFVTDWYSDSFWLLWGRFHTEKYPLVELK